MVLVAHGGIAELARAGDQVASVTEFGCIAVLLSH